MFLGMGWMENTNDGNHSLSYTFWASALGAEHFHPLPAATQLLHLLWFYPKAQDQRIHYFRPFLKILLQAHKTNQLQQLFLKDIKKNLQHLYVLSIPSLK